MSLIGCEVGTSRRKSRDAMGVEEATLFVSAEIEHFQLKLARGPALVDLAALDVALKVARQHGMWRQAEVLQQIADAAKAQ